MSTSCADPDRKRYAHKQCMHLTPMRGCNAYMHLPIVLVGKTVLTPEYAKDEPKHAIPSVHQRTDSTDSRICSVVPESCVTCAMDNTNVNAMNHTTCIIKDGIDMLLILPHDP